MQAGVAALQRKSEDDHELGKVPVRASTLVGKEGARANIRWERRSRRSHNGGKGEAGQQQVPGRCELGKSKGNNKRQAGATQGKSPDENTPSEFDDRHGKRDEP